MTLRCESSRHVSHFARIKRSAEHQRSEVDRGDGVGAEEWKGGVRRAVTFKERQTNPAANQSVDFPSERAKKRTEEGSSSGKEKE